MSMFGKAVVLAVAAAVVVGSGTAVAAPAVQYTKLHQSKNFWGRTFFVWRNDSNGRIHAQLTGASGTDQIAGWMCYTNPAQHKNVLGYLTAITKPVRGQVNTPEYAPVERGLSYRVSINDKAYSTPPTKGQPIGPGDSC